MPRFSVPFSNFAHQRLTLLHLIIIAIFVGFCRCRTESEAQVQCSAMCLSNYLRHATPKEMEVLSANLDQIMFMCSARNTSSSVICRTCLKACAVKMKPPQASLCDKECKITGSLPASLSSSRQCQAACLFLFRLLTTNPGRCPAFSPSSSISAASSSLYRFPKCEEDRHCYRTGTKCCLRGRHKACMKAELSKADLPPVPQNLRVVTSKTEDGKRKRVKHLTMILDWSGYNLSAVSDPIIFLVQIRDYKGYQFDQSAVSPWMDLIMTSRRRTVLADLKAGTWYQMRIAAISQRGMLSYSAPTTQQKLREARRPSPPRDLREDVSRIHQRKVDVNIRWEPPKRRDLPISKYEIVWREHYSFRWGEESSSSRYSATVPPSASQFMIRDLKPSTMYKIELTAIVHYGNYQLRSKHISLFITTTHIPTLPPREAAPLEVGSPTSSTYNETECLCGMAQGGGPLTVGLSFYDAGKLQVPLHWNRGFKGPVGTSIDSYILEWAPKVCVASVGLKTGVVFGKPFEATVDDSKVQFLSNLHFNCHYTLTVKGLTDTGQEALQWETCFCTTSCVHTAVKQGSERPTCTGESLAYIPQRPRNVRSRVWRTKSGSPYSADIVWDSPSGPAQIHSYSIVWGPRIFEPVDKSLYGTVLTPKLDIQHTESKVVHLSQNRHILHHLQRGTLYIVMLKFLSRDGDSPVSTLYFRTPGDNKNEKQLEVVRQVLRPSANAAPHRKFMHPCLLLLSFIVTLAND